MRIGIDGLPLTEVLTGIGYYTLELARHLALTDDADAIEVVAPRDFQPTLNSVPSSLHNLRLVRSRVSPVTRHWWAIGLPRYLNRHRVDVFHGTNYEAPLRQVCPSVVTIHDLSMLLFSHTQEAKRVRRARRRLPLMARAATMIVTPTQNVRREVHQHLGVPLERIVAVPEAARSCFYPALKEETLSTRMRLGITDEFLLFVGTVEPRKNLGTLLRAFEAIQPQLERRVQLVIAGRKGWLVDDLMAAIKKSPVAERIVMTGYLEDADLRALYSSCAAFIYPSVYEGFGLPPLEAMACGAPVIAADIPSLREVTGEAALLFPPERSDELAQAMLDLLLPAQHREEGPAAPMAAAGIKRAGQFSWESTARATRDVYREAIARFQRS
jgi:glycosyltransferase involved in cell wall biosynthesis